MTFQSTVRQNQAAGIVGEIAFDGPYRAEPAILRSVDAAYNVIGRAFTAVAAEDGVAKAGGAATDPFAGILVNPLVYATAGTVAGALTPTLVLPNETQAELLKMGTILVSLAAAANIGDLVTYDTTTGALSSLAPEAAFTAAQALGVLTVSAITAGKIGIGSVIKNASGQVLGTVISLGTGTGGTGTYNLNTSATVGSAAMTANSIAVAGQAVVPNTKVVRQNIPSAGLAYIQLTN